jgi:hypothetical protein
MPLNDKQAHRSPMDADDGDLAARAACQLVGRIERRKKHHHGRRTETLLYVGAIIYSIFELVHARSQASVMRVLPTKLTNPSTTIARPKSDKNDQRFS